MPEHGTVTDTIELSTRSTPTTADTAHVTPTAAVSAVTASEPAATTAKDAAVSQSTEALHGKQGPTDTRTPPTDGAPDRTSHDETEHDKPAAPPLPRQPVPPGAEKHYWTVELKAPAGAHAALKSVVGLSESAIQVAVDLLGRGMPLPPPQVGDLLKSVVLADLGKGAATVGYRRAINAVNARQTALLSYDNAIAQTSIVVADKKDQTLSRIKNIVGELQSLLKACPAKPTKPQEAALMSKVGSAVTHVYRLVDAVYAANQEMAGSSGSRQSSDTASKETGDATSGTATGGEQSAGAAQSAGGDGGIGGILGQLLPMAAMMLPMGAMALTPVVTEMMQKNQQDQEEKAAEQQNAAANDQAQNAQAGAAAAPPAAPGAPVPNGAGTTAPAAVTPAPAGDASAPTPITPTTSGTPGTPPPITTAPASLATGRTTPRRTRDGSVTGDPADAVPEGAVADDGGAGAAQV